jgi:hypothetical protein
MMYREYLEGLLMLLYRRLERGELNRKRYEKLKDKLTEWHVHSIATNHFKL